MRTHGCRRRFPICWRATSNCARPTPTTGRRSPGCGSTSWSGRSIRTPPTSTARIVAACSPRLRGETSGERGDRSLEPFLVRAGPGVHAWRVSRPVLWDLAALATAARLRALGRVLARLLDADLAVRYVRRAAAAARRVDVAASDLEGVAAPQCCGTVRAAGNARRIRRRRVLDGPASQLRPDP